MIRALLVLLALLLVPATAYAGPGKVTVGLADGASADEVAALAASVTGGTVDRDLEDLEALVVTVPDVAAARAALDGLSGVEYTEPVLRSRSLAFETNDPLLLLQWYLNAVRAFEFWDALPVMAPVRVAVIDSGIDGGHPEFKGRIAAAKSFVKGSPLEDTIGHGTLVAGEIAAAIDNAEGIAGVGFPVELLIAKVTAPGGSISLEAEAKAIEWAVANGADVINLSLGGLRDPRHPSRDQYSRLEHQAIAHAYSSGAVVVAASGNCDAFVGCPYAYASWPAALPHVLGVSAVDQNGKAPPFSNRDKVFNDLAAPGVSIVSTFPRSLTNPECGWPGYNICAQPGRQLSDGTSFSAPLVSAAAALLIAQKPQLLPSQVMTLLELSAVDVDRPGRDPFTGNGRLDVAAALGAALTLAPPADRYETNDDAGGDAKTLWGKKWKFAASIDYYDDPSDVYRVYLRKGQRLRIVMTGPKGTRPTLVVWRPGTKHVTAITKVAVRSGSVVAHKTAVNPKLFPRAKRTGWYYVEVRAPKARRGGYTLAMTKR